MSGGYTRLGALIWEWEPFINLNNDARILYLGLYTSSPAKRLIPGLFHGSVQSMAEAARMGYQETWTSLDTLLEREIVEYDDRHRVLRMELPDAGEWPSGPNILYAWWNRFQVVPECDVRDAHVTTLRRLIERGAREAAMSGAKTKGKRHTGRPSDAHEECWADTFAQVKIPVSRRRGKRRMDEMNAGLAAQPGLFDPRGVAPLLESRANFMLAEGSSPLLNDPKELNSEGGCHPRGLGEGEGEGEGGSFLSTEPIHAGGADHGIRRPALALVPPIHPYDTMLVTIAEATNGRYKPVAREGLHDALCATVRELERANVTAADLALVGRWIASGVDVGIGAIGGEPISRLSVWASEEGAVLAALDAARRHELEAREASAHLADLRKQLGFS